MDTQLTVKETRIVIDALRAYAKQLGCCDPGAAHIADSLEQELDYETGADAAIGAILAHYSR